MMTSVDLVGCFESCRYPFQAWQLPGGTTVIVEKVDYSVVSSGAVE